MKKVVTTTYHCEVCEEVYSKEKNAVECEAKVACKCKDIQVGDTVYPMYYEEEGIRFDIPTEIIRIHFAKRTHIRLIDVKNDNRQHGFVEDQKINIQFWKTKSEE